MKKILLFILLPAYLISKDEPKSLMLGVTTGVNYISNQTDYNIIDGDTCCGNFNSGQDMGFYTGLNFEYEIISNFIHLQSRALFDSRPATLSAETSDYKVYNPNTESYDDATIRNDFDATINYFTFGINLLIQPLSSIPIRFGLGYDLSDASITNEFEQTRNIIEPSGLMINGKNTEVVDNGNMDNLTTSQGLSLGLSAKIDLDDRISLNPEFIYRHPINYLVDNSDWTSRIFRAGASIMVSLNSVEDKYDDSTIDDKMQDLEQEEESEIIVVKEDSDTQQEVDAIENISTSQLIINETVVTQTYPILPYIFFEESSSELDSKYKLIGTTSNFSINDLEKNSLSIYYRMIDIIAYRIQSYNSEITVTGFTDGVELKDSVKRIELAKARALNTKKYLVEKWSIPNDLVKINYTELPYAPTSNEYTDGLSENRRVKISSNDSRILEPIVHSEFQEYKLNKESIDVDLEISDLNGIEDLTLTVSENEKTLYSKTYFDKIDEQYKIDIDNDLLDLLAKSDKESLHAEVMITKQNGNIETKKVPLKVGLDKSNFELGRINLIVFDFDKSEISNENKNMIDEFIIDNIKDNSVINVVGSTDYLGKKDYNKKLSTSRARNVVNYIKQLVPDANFKKVVGIGSDNPKYDNSKPEGRFYCRTVFVGVKTPILE